ncbi:MAG: signal peptidase I, partial [Tenericutes bacterium]|nr:signal peptidase I [Mycoplasmatota bacterium]
LYGTTDFSAGDLGFFSAILAALVAYAFVIFVIWIVTVIGTWKIYEKAQRPGWASIIPIYSQYVLFEMVGMKGWYIFLAFIPFFGAIIVAIMAIIAYVKLAACFKKETLFAIGLILLPVVFFPILGFDSSTYTKPQ